MKYKFIPGINEVNLPIIDWEKFLDLQVKYRESFEKMLMRYVNFQGIDEYIKSFGVLVPIIEDFDYNFYHKFSYLGSQYIFLRNNIHIERLSVKDQQMIVEAINKTEVLDDDFLIRTYQTVLFEKGDNVFLGVPRDETRVNSQSLFFEFAYDEKRCDTLKQIYGIRDIALNTLNFLKEALNAQFDVLISLYVYGAIVDEFLTTDTNNN